MTDARGRVEAICVVSRLTPDPGSVGTTAIDKRPVDGPVRIGTTGVYADIQADRAHHGGADQAVYVLDAAEAAHWERELGRVIPAGGLGENIRATGLRVDDLEIGARLRLGTVLLEVTAPRTPCATFERWMGVDGFRQAYHERGRTGAYCRVIEPGQAQAGDELVVEHAPGHGVTVAACYAATRDREVARALHDWSSASGVALHREIVRRNARLLGDGA